MPIKVLLLPQVLARPAFDPAKKLLLPAVFDAPEYNPMKTLLTPLVVLQIPAQNPVKKLLLPVPPVPDIQLTILVELHTLNALLPPPTKVPLT